MRASEAVPVLSVLLAAPAFTQSVISAKSGLVEYIERRAFLNDHTIRPRFGHFPQMKAQDVLATGRGRAEVLLNPDVFLRLGPRSSVRLLSDRLTDSQIELVSGCFIVEAGNVRKEAPVTLVWRGATVSIVKRGLYRFDTPLAEVRTFGGRILVELGGKQVALGKGECLLLDGTRAKTRFDRRQTDAFDEWSSNRSRHLAASDWRDAETSQAVRHRGRHGRLAMYSAAVDASEGHSP